MSNLSPSPDDRTERLEIEHHADLLERRWKEYIDAFPNQHYGGGDDWVSEEHPGCQENAAIPETGQSSDSQVGENLVPAGPGQVFRDDCVIELQEQGHYLQTRACREDDDGGEQSGEVFSSQKDLAPHGCEQIKVQALVEHFSTKQINKNADTTEENREPEKIGLKGGGEEHRPFGNGLGAKFSDVIYFAFRKEEPVVGLAIGVFVHQIAPHPFGLWTVCHLRVGLAEFFNDLLASEAHPDGLQSNG